MPINTFFAAKRRIRMEVIRRKCFAAGYANTLFGWTPFCFCAPVRLGIALLRAVLHAFNVVLISERTKGRSAALANNLSMEITHG
jgi:hypothetical protein